MSDDAGGWKRNPFVTGLLGLTLGLLLAYGVGLWQRSAALSAQLAAHVAVLTAKDGEIAAAMQQLTETQRQARAAESQVALLQVRLGLYQALNDIDQRNFGSAGDHIREAASAFDRVDAAAVGLDPGLLSALQSDVAGTEVLIAIDFEAQRLQVRELIARIEAQTASAFGELGATMAPTVAPEADPAVEPAAAG